MSHVVARNLAMQCVRWNRRIGGRRDSKEDPAAPWADGAEVANITAHTKAQTSENTFHVSRQIQ